MATLSQAEQTKINDVLATVKKFRDEIRGSLSLQAVGASHIANGLDDASKKLTDLGAV